MLSKKIFLINFNDIVYFYKHKSLVVFGVFFALYVHCTSFLWKYRAVPSPKIKYRKDRNKTKNFGCHLQSNNHHHKNPRISIKILSIKLILEIHRKAKTIKNLYKKVKSKLTTNLHKNKISMVRHP